MRQRGISKNDETTSFPPARRTGLRTAARAGCMALFSMLALTSATAQVQVASKIDSAAILIGEQAHLRTVVTANSTQKVTFPDFRRGDTLMAGVEVLEASGVDTVLLNEGKRMQLGRTYTITSFDSALYYIPGMEVLVDGRKYRSQDPIGLKVNTVPVDTVHIDRIRGPHAVVEEPFTWSARLWGPALTLFVLLPFVYWLLVRLSGKKPVTRRVVIPPKELPHKVVMAELESIKKSALSDSGEAKEYYIRLTDALRNYIQERFGFNAKEMTSAEIIARLTETKDETALRELREVLSTADLVKFAKHQATLNENDRNLINAIDFVNSTKAEPAEADKPKVKVVVLGDKRQRQIRLLTKAALALSATGAAALTWYLYREIILTFL